MTGLHDTIRKALERGAHLEDHSFSFAFTADEWLRALLAENEAQAKEIERLKAALAKKTDHHDADGRALMRATKEIADLKVHLGETCEIAKEALRRLGVFEDSEQWQEIDSLRKELKEARARVAELEAAMPSARLVNTFRVMLRGRTLDEWLSRVDTACNGKDVER